MPFLGGDADSGQEALCGGVFAVGAGFQSKQVPDGSSPPVRDSVTRQGFALANIRLSEMARGNSYPAFTDGK